MGPIQVTMLREESHHYSSALGLGSPNFATDRRYCSLFSAGKAIWSNYFQLYYSKDDDKNR